MPIPTIARKWYRLAPCSKARFTTAAMLAKRADLLSTDSRPAKQRSCTPNKIAAGYALPPFLVITDIGCIKDYVKATGAEGIEKSKLPPDLFTYGCVREFALGVYGANSFDRQVIASLTGPVVMWKVTLGFNTGETATEVLLGSRNKMMDRLEKAFDMDEVVARDVWIFDKDFLRIGEDEVIALLMKARGKASHAFRGKVERVDTVAQRLTVTSEKLEGWMDAITMQHSVDKADDVVRSVKAGDQITATVYDGDSRLYNVQVVPKK